jgi:hypothetical protein
MIMSKHAGISCGFARVSSGVFLGARGPENSKTPTKNGELQKQTQNRFSRLGIGL